MYRLRVNIGTRRATFEVPKIFKYLFIGALIGLTIYRFYIAYRVPVLIIVQNAGYDDAIYVDMVETLLSGQWLGEYSDTTLLKGITYGIFLCISYVTRIPYTILLTATVVVAVIVFLKAIYPLYSNFYVGSLLYLVMIYSPQTFNCSVTQRLYRNALTLPLTLLIFAGVLGVYFNINNKKRWAYSILSGASLALFWNLREDSIWIVPFVVVASAIAAGLAIYSLLKTEKGKSLWVGMAKTLGVVLLPLLIVLVINNGICALNYKYYGIYALNDRTSSSFDEVISLCIKIDYEEDESIDPKYCYTSYDKLAYIIDHSPTLAEYKEVLLANYGRRTNAEGALYGDSLQWIFRLALSSAGLYEDGASTEAFFAQVAAELQQALDSGELQYKDGIFLSSSTRMITTDEIPELIMQTINEDFVYMLGYNRVAAETVYSTGNTAALSNVEFIVNSYYLSDSDTEGTIYYRWANLFVNIANKIIELYKKLATPMTRLSLIAFAVMTILQLGNLFWRNRRLFDYWLIGGATLCSAFANLFIYSVFRGTWLGVAPMVFYCSGAYILWLAFQLIGIVFIAEMVVKAICRLRAIRRAH